LRRRWCSTGAVYIEDAEEAWFNVNMMQKDMNLALELGGN